jgi:coenzyme PQQ precursor peptide PqqA
MRTYYWLFRNSAVGPDLVRAFRPKETNMAWTTPTLVEICIGLEINGYLPAEF